MYEKYILAYGLSANPIHQVHVDLVVDAVNALTIREYEITKVIIIPVYRRNPVGPKKKDDLPMNFDYRFVLCDLAAREMTQKLQETGISVEVSRIDEFLAKPGILPNYTLETLSYLRTKSDSKTGIIFLLSSDLVSGDDPEFGHWYQPERLVQVATLAICPRPGYQRNNEFLKEFEDKGARFVYLDELMPRDVAASKIKERLESGESPFVLQKEGLLPATVAESLANHNFYRIKKLIDEYLSVSRLLNLATVHNSKPWIATAWYVSDSNWNLYFHSQKTRRHSIELKDNPYVAGAVVVPPYPQNRGEKVRGLQFDGFAYECPPDILLDIRELYLSKFAGSPEIPAETLQNPGCRTTFYVVHLTKMVLTDQITFPENYRQEFELSH